MQWHLTFLERRRTPDKAGSCDGSRTASDRSDLVRERSKLKDQAMCVPDNIEGNRRVGSRTPAASQAGSLTTGLCSSGLWRCVVVLYEVINPKTKSKCSQLSEIRISYSYYEDSKHIFLSNANRISGDRWPVHWIINRPLQSEVNKPPGEADNSILNQDKHWKYLYNS
jgi:hypothetical protein